MPITSQYLHQFLLNLISSDANQYQSSLGQLNNVLREMMHDVNYDNALVLQRLKHALPLALHSKYNSLGGFFSQGITEFSRRHEMIRRESEQIVTTWEDEIAHRLEVIRLEHAMTQLFNMQDGYTHP